MTKPPILHANSIHVGLSGRPVLKGVSLEAAPGEIIAIVGPNGAGKSTLLRAISGLLPLSQGRVTLEGRDLADTEPKALARAIAYLPQERTVHWPMSVRAVVALGRMPYRSAFAGLSADDVAAVAAAMKAMDVASFAERSVSELSGGERARVLVARALAQGARILVADEPTAGLDPAHALALFEHFQRLTYEGRTVLVALHDLSLAARFCHRLVLMKRGEVIASGSSETVLAPEPLAKAYGIRARLAHVDGVPILVSFEALS